MRHRRGLLAVALIASAGAAGCGFPEQRVVDQYFGALNAKDNQTLSSFAAVSLDTQGKRVDKWRINQVSAEQRQPAPHIELLKNLKQAEAAVEANKTEYKKYYMDYPEQVDQVQQALKKGAEPPAKLQAYTTKWRAFIEQEKSLKKAAEKAKNDLEREKRNVSLSIGAAEGIEGMTGEMISKTYDVGLTIAGAVKDYQMTLRKYQLTGGQAPRMSRWIVYEIEAKP